MDEGDFSVVAEIARRIKREKVVEFGDDPDESLSDVMSFVVGLRQRKQLFMLVHGPGPESARECVYLAATYLYSCDELFQVADARYKAFQPVEGWQEGMSAEEYEKLFYEQTGYGPGSIGKLWESGQREDIQECLVIHRMPFAGPITSANYNYERNGRNLKWTHVLQTPESQQSGAIIDYFKGGLRKRKELYPVLEKMGRDTLNDMTGNHDFTKEEAQYWVDRGMAKFLSKYAAVFLVHYLGEVKELGLGPVLFYKGDEIGPDEAERLRNDG